MPCVQPFISKNMCCPNPLVLNACSTNLVVDTPQNVLILDASKGSLCEVMIRSSVKNIIVKGDQSSYVSVVFQPSGFGSSAFQGASTAYGNNCQYTENTKTTHPGLSTPSSYQIGCMRIGNVHKFEILGVAKGVTFGSIVNNAKYLTLNQTQNLTDYGIQLFGDYSKEQIRSVTSDTLIIGSFLNYGHFLVKTTNLGGVFYKKKNCCNVKNKDTNCDGPGYPRNETPNCEEICGKPNFDKCLCDDRTFWLVNVLIRCKLHSTGRNKNFRIPLGILYLWAGADVKLCNISCECIQGPKPCECFDAICYDSDATLAPLINCVAVVCGINEILPDRAPCSPSIGYKAKCGDGSGQCEVWKNCKPKGGCDNDCTDNYGYSKNNHTRIFGKEFKSLNVNPCFLKNVNFQIKCSDLIICELVKRVWTCPLGSQCIDNATCNPCNPQPFVSTCCDQTYVKTSGGIAPCDSAINSARIYSYLINFTALTPALYLGNNLNKDADFDCSSINVERLVWSSGMDPGDNNWPSGGNVFTNYCYALLFSKCKDDPVIDPKTTYPRRCTNLYCEYTIPDRVRPYSGRDFCATELASACKPIIPCEDTLNTVCRPVCPEVCKVLPSQKAQGKCCYDKTIIRKQCCKLVKPNQTYCLVQNQCEGKPPPVQECTYLKPGGCDDETWSSVSCSLNCPHDARNYTYSDVGSNNDEVIGDLENGYSDDNL